MDFNDKVMICSIITKSMLDVHFVKKIPFGNGDWSADERRGV